MNYEHLVHYVVGEVDELMGAGRVGLYEFFEILRSEGAPLSYDEMLAVSQAALHHLLESGIAVLAWQVWAEPRYSRPATSADVTASAWATPTEAPYLAVEPT